MHGQQNIKILLVVNKHLITKTQNKKHFKNLQ